MSIFYISDLHFGHANIIKHCNRPFRNVEEMNESIITNWNEVVGVNDVVYIVGDFAHKSEDPAELLYRLNGTKNVILGNHDIDIRRIPGLTRPSIGLCVMTSYLEIDDNGRRVVMSHYPMAEWNGFFRGAIHLYGHIHNNIANPAYKIMKEVPNAYNVGADILDFVPRPLDDVIAFNKQFFANN